MLHLVAGLPLGGVFLTRDNVRLAHRPCNRRDYTWRTKINALLGERMSLEEIAERLNVEKVQRFTARTDGQLHLFEGIRFLEAPWAVDAVPADHPGEAPSGPFR